jgi:hypothetical protein
MDFCIYKRSIIKNLIPDTQLALRGYIVQMNIIYKNIKEKKKENFFFLISTQYNLAIMCFD